MSTIYRPALLTTMTDRSVAPLLIGKVALITGAGSGIGKAAALGCAAAGARVVLVGRDVDKLAATAGEIDEASERTMKIVIDLTASTAPAACVERALARFSKIDILVNAAGTAAPEAFVHEMADADFDAMLDMNLRSVFRLSRAVLPQMIAQRSGSIINVASIAGQAAMPGMAGYAAAKAGIIALSRTIAVEYGPSGIRCNAVSPGTIATPMTQEVLDDEDRAAGLAAATFLSRVGVPSDVAGAVLYLASELSAFVTGTVLVVDGGYLAR